MTCFVLTCCDIASQRSVCLLGGIYDNILVSGHKADKFVDACVNFSRIINDIFCIIQICSTALARFMRPSTIVIQTVPMEISTLVAAS